jgi:hypothetical protein
VAQEQGPLQEVPEVLDSVRVYLVDDVDLLRVVSPVVPLALTIDRTVNGGFSMRRLTKACFFAKVVRSVELVTPGARLFSCSGRFPPFPSPRITLGRARLSGSGDDLHIHGGFRGDPYGQAEDGWGVTLGVELWRVFRLQLLPGRWLEEDRHGVVLSAKLDNLLDDFGGDSHVPIVLVNFCCKELWLI